MNVFIEILKIMIPGLIVFFTSYFLVKMFINKEKYGKELEIRKKHIEKSLPLRLQAYERMILFLERISPNQLIMRVMRKEMKASQLQMAMIQTIRQEYEHNISQQLYISNAAWEHVKNAKEEMIQMVNTITGKLNDNASATDLGSLIIKEVAEKKNFSVFLAINSIKNEVRVLF